jgi:Na+-driven multidrug efflux pump
MFRELGFDQSVMFFLAVFVIVSLIGAWRGRKEVDPVKAATVKFKYVSIGCAIFLYGLTFGLPSTFVATLTSPDELKTMEDVHRHYSGLASSVDRLRDILQFFIFTLILWGLSLLEFAKVLAGRVNKGSD